MKILHVIAPVEFGGGESLLINLIKEKSPDVNEQVALIYSSKIFEERLRAEGVKYFVFRKKSLGFGLSRIAVFWQTFVNLFLSLKLLKIIKNNSFDLVHIHGYPGSLLFALIRKFTKVKAVYTHHFYRRKPALLEKIIFEHIYSAFNKCIGVSELVCSSMNSAFPKLKNKFVCIYNCISNDFYNARIDQSYKNLFKEKIAFVQVARFTYFKNHLLVVNALKNLSEDVRKKILVVFVGDGPLKAKIMEEVNKLGINDSVNFMGFIPNDKLPNLLASCNFGLFPSDNEGFGLGAVECMAVGLPVLTLDTELMQEIVGEGGIAVSKNELGQGFTKIIQTDKAICQKAIQKSLRFKPSIIKNEYLKNYKNV